MGKILLILLIIVTLGCASANPINHTKGVVKLNGWDIYTLMMHTTEVTVYQSQESGRCLYVSDRYKEIAIGELTSEFCLELIKLNEPK